MSADFDSAATRMRPQVDPFEVYAIRYAKRDGNRAQNLLEYDPHDGPMGLDYYVWVARSPQRTFVVDTGLSREIAQRRGRDFLRCPIESLNLLGIDPADVGDVILTHIHNDHAANLEKLPNARIHVQDREMAFATGRYMKHPYCGRGYELDEVLRLVRLNYSGRVEFHNGSDELCEGVSLHHVGGHTEGLQFVRVWTRRGWLVLASDVSHFYENFENNRPMRLVFEVGRMFDAYAALKRMASSNDMIVPGHDPKVMDKFPPARPDLAGIVARLD